MESVTLNQLKAIISENSISTAYRSGYSAQYKGTSRYYNPHTHNLRRGVECESLFGEIDREPFYAEKRKEEMWEKGFNDAILMKNFGFHVNTISEII